MGVLTVGCLSQSYASDNKGRAIRTSTENVNSPKYAAATVRSIVKPNSENVTTNNFPTQRTINYKVDNYGTGRVVTPSQQKSVYGSQRVLTSDDLRKMQDFQDKNIKVPTHAPSITRLPNGNVVYGYTGTPAEPVKPGKPQPYKDPRTLYRPTNPNNTPRGPNSWPKNDTSKRPTETASERRIRIAEWRKRNRHRDRDYRNHDSRDLTVVLPTLAATAGYLGGQYYDSSYEPTYVKTTSYVPQDTYAVPVTNRSYVYGSWEGRPWGPLTIGAKHRGRIYQNDLIESEYDSCWYDSQDRLLCKLDDVWYTASE